MALKADDDEPLTRADIDGIVRGRRAIAAGNCITLDELRRDLGGPRRVARRKSARPRTRR